MDNEIARVPIHLKMTLSVKETAEYSNIGVNKTDSLLHAPNWPFVLFAGTKKLVKRKEFEHFISQQPIIWLFFLFSEKFADLTLRKGVHCAIIRV